MAKHLIIYNNISPPSLANDQLPWLNNAKVALRLTYNDALNSQLHHVLPALKKLNFKATFYITLNSSTVADRLTDWRKAAQQGHKLGNHSINHACRGSLPKRE